jgi:hypothetical protein
MPLDDCVCGETGRNTRVVYQSVKAYVDSLPAVKIKPYHAAGAVN